MASSSAVLLRGVSTETSSPLSRAFSAATATEGRLTLSIFAVVLSLGLALGFATDNASFLSSVGGAWPRVSNVLGWTYFSAWSISFWPQILQNAKRGTVSGLSFDFIFLNFVGFSCYTAYNTGLYWSPTIRAEYAADHGGSLPSVQSQDVFFGIHAVALTGITIAQIGAYDRGGQTVSLLARAILGVLVTLMAGAAAVVASGAGGFRWLDYLTFLSWVKVAITLMKYIPQALLNYRRKSTKGWT